MSTLQAGGKIEGGSGSSRKETMTKDERRKKLEPRLWKDASGRGFPGQLYDCGPLGFCSVRWEQLGWLTRWWDKAIKRKEKP